MRQEGTHMSKEAGGEEILYLTGWISLDTEIPYVTGWISLDGS